MGATGLLGTTAGMRATLGAVLGIGGALLAALVFTPPTLAASPMQPRPATDRLMGSPVLANQSTPSPPRWGATPSPTLTFTPTLIPTPTSTFTPTPMPTPTLTFTPTPTASRPLGASPTPTAVAPLILAPDARGPLPPATGLAPGQTPPAAASGGALAPVPLPPTNVQGVLASSAITPTPTSTPALGLLSTGPGVAPPAAVGTAGAAGGSPSGTARLVPELPATPNGARIVNLAQSLVGSRYTWGGSSPTTGFDCSGLVHHIFRSLGYTIGRTVEEQFTAGRRVRLEELRPGDVVFYQNTYMRGLSHNGIYLGGGRFVHAVDESTGVAITPLNSPYWEQRYVGAIRLVD